MAAAAEAGSDICVLTSDNPRSEDPDAIIADAAKGFARPKNHATIPDRREAIKVAIENARDGDIILVAGKGHEDYQEIQGVKHNFDDRRMVRQLLMHMFSDRDAARTERELEREAERAAREGSGTPPPQREREFRPRREDDRPRRDDDRFGPAPGSAGDRGPPPRR